jgi:23S rRNA (cytidine1920-2'-O)/16S rRNA (cytidine1409-2'-O)-methyltransferase
MRLDEALVARGLFVSRARARDAVLRGTVSVNGVAARKVSQTVQDKDELVVHDAAQRFVSRAALKLLHALDVFKIEAEGRVALDIGASTGGFTQVLLERGAAHVIAVDVGHGQMVAEIAEDPRVQSFEGLNARVLTREHVPGTVGLIVCDVSFISLKLALPVALDLVGQGSRLIALIKPQFEVGKENVGRGGMVTDPSEHNRVCSEISDFLVASGWEVLGIEPSPMLGGDGNKEFLIVARKR